MDNRKRLTAEEARKIEIDLTKVLDLIMEKIKERAIIGHTHLNIYPNDPIWGILSNVTILKLESLGYKYKCINKRRTVSWGE